MKVKYILITIGFLLVSVPGLRGQDLGQTNLIIPGDNENGYRYHFLTGLDLTQLFQLSNLEIEGIFSIQGNATQSDGYVEMTIMALNSFGGYHEEIAKFRRDASGNETFPDITQWGYDRKGAQMKVNAQQGRAWYMRCVDDDPSEYATSLASIGLISSGALMAAGAGGLKAYGNSLAQAYGIAKKLDGGEGAEMMEMGVDAATGEVAVEASAAGAEGTALIAGATSLAWTGVGLIAVGVAVSIVAIVEYENEQEEKKAEIREFKTYYQETAKAFLGYYQGRLSDGGADGEEFNFDGASCGIPMPIGPVVIEVVGRNFDLEGVTVPCYIGNIDTPSLIPGSRFRRVTDTYPPSVTTYDGAELISPQDQSWTLPYEEVLQGPNGPLNPLYLIPKSFPRELLKANVSTKVRVTFDEETNGWYQTLYVLSDPEIFMEKIGETYEFQDHGPIFYQPVHNQESYDQLHRYNLFEVFRPSDNYHIDFWTDTYGPFLLNEKPFGKTTEFNESHPVYTQGNGFQAQQIGYGLQLPVDGEEQLSVDWRADILLGKNILNFIPEAASELTIFKPEVGSSLYALVRNDLNPSWDLCNEFISAFWKGSCEFIGTYNGNFDLIRYKYEGPESGQVQEFVNFPVGEWGPFLVVNFEHKEISSENQFNLSGIQLEYKPLGPAGLYPHQSRIYLGQKLGHGDLAYSIHSMADNYTQGLLGQTVIPTSIVQLSTNYGKAFSQQSDFFVVSVPTALPADWVREDKGEFFIAENNWQESATFHLYKVTDAKGKLFTITNAGPFVVGTDGSLDTSYDQFRRMSNFSQPPPED